MDSSKVDRLGDLGDDVLLQILARLEMKDAVTTGILSKRWNRIWNRIESVVYKFEFDVDDDKPVREQKLRQFIYFVNQSSPSCNLNLKNLEMSICYEDFDMDVRGLVSNCVTSVLEMRTIDCLKLRISSYLGYDVPDFIYLNTSYANLHFEGVQLFRTAPVNWPILNTVLFKWMYLGLVDLHSVFVGSPLLETLVIEEVEGLSDIFPPPSVKKLKLVSYDCEDEEIYRITAPRLKELELLVEYPSTRCELLDVSSLVKARIEFIITNILFDEFYAEIDDEESLGWIHMVIQLLKSVSRVDELIIGSHAIQVLTWLKLEAKPSPLFKCNYLSIDSSLWKYDLPGIAHLLEMAPDLDTLLLKTHFSSKKVDPVFHVGELYDNGDPHLSMTSSNFVNLKNVKIVYSQEESYESAGNTNLECLDFEILKYILKGAVSIEKLVLCSPTGSSFCRSWILNLSQLLSTFLIGSQVTEWELKEVNDGRFEFHFHQESI